MLKLFGLQLRQSISTAGMENLTKTKLTKLTDRSLLILNGPQSHKLIQGLITNDTRELKEIKKQQYLFTRVALYTLFLQPKGKVITDAFIFKPRMYSNGKAVYSNDQLWIDVNKQNKKQLKDHLKRHMWRKNVQLVDVQQSAENGQHIPSIYAGYNKDNPISQFMLGGSIELEQLQNGQDQTYANLLYYDPRGSQFGLRIVSSQEQMNIEGHYQDTSIENHKLLLQKLGASSIELAVNKLPFQFNYDLLNAISLKKGCYIGQEIVSRGMLAGIIRRRIFPFTIQNQSEINIDADTILKNESGEQYGKVIKYSKGQGIVLLNYLGFLEKNATWPLKFTLPYPGQILSPFGDKLTKYFNNMRDKQKILEQLQL